MPITNTVRKAHSNNTAAKKAHLKLVKPEHSTDPVDITFTIRGVDGPALVAAIDEISNEVGGRLEGAHAFPVEDALTRASIALAQLRKRIYATFPNADPNYKTRPAKKRDR